MGEESGEAGVAMGLTAGEECNWGVAWESVGSQVWVVDEGGWTGEGWGP